MSLKYDHHSFEKCLFVHFSIISGLHCIIFVDNQNLTKTNYWRYRVTTDIYLMYCYKHLIDLHDKIFIFVSVLQNHI